MSARPMGYWMALALVMGSMIGSGVFLLPASLAPLGWASVAGWLITISGTLCIAAVFARLAAALPRAGGPYAYVREAFGDAPAFLIAWTYWISMWVGNAAIITAGVSYLSRLFPPLASVPGASAAASLGFVWLFTATNIRGARLAGGIQLVTMAIKLVPLAAVLLIAAWVLTAPDAHGLVLPAPEAGDFSLDKVATAAALTLWAMLGIEVATVPAEKVADPARTIPLATLTGAGAAGLLYVLVCSAIVLMLPATQIAASPAPFADFADRFLGGDSGAWIAAFGAISAIGAMNGWLMVQGELPAAMARTGLFPAFFARATAAGTPWLSHVISSCLLSIVVLLNYSKTMADLFQFLILLTGAIVLVMYLACALAAAWLLRTGKLTAPGWFRAVIAAGILYSLWTFHGAGAEALAWGAALIAAGIPAYALLWRTRRRPS